MPHVDLIISTRSAFVPIADLDHVRKSPHEQCTMECDHIFAAGMTCPSLEGDKDRPSEDVLSSASCGAGALLERPGTFDKHDYRVALQRLPVATKIGMVPIPRGGS